MDKSQSWFWMLCAAVAVNLVVAEVAFSGRWILTYDNMDRLAGRTDPLGRSESFTHDLAGNLIRHTDRKDQITTYSYDSLNRLTDVFYADSSTTTISYDVLGRPVAIIDSIGGKINFVYDNLNRVVQQTSGQGTVAYTYDVLGRRTSMTVNGQPPIIYSYDLSSRLIQVAQGSLSVAMSYDAKDRRTALTYSNGTLATYTYDAASRLNGIFHAKDITSFESISYAFDAAGNRTVAVRGSNPSGFLPGTLQATYDAANEQISLNNALFTLTYDANGNLATRTDITGTTTYSWDARNRLIGITGPGLTASFVYDALDRRITKTVNGATTQYTYDHKNIVQELSNGAVAATYLRSLDLDEPFIRVGSSTEFFHRDALGTTLMLTDEAGGVKTTYKYSPFGETVATGTASTNPFQYTGRENDGTGLYYYRARYYNPAAQRFISEDPAGFLGGINLYAYVMNNPVNYVDPDGTIRLPPGIGGMPPRAPVTPPRPNLPPNDPPQYRPLEPQQMPSGEEFIPKTPAWMRLLKRLLGDDDLDVTMPGVVCIDLHRPAGVPAPLGGRKDDEELAPRKDLKSQPDIAILMMARHDCACLFRLSRRIKTIPLPSMPLVWHSFSCDTCLTNINENLSRSC